MGMKESPVTWNVPSNESPVDPLGPPHWSSKFGDVNVQDFAIQISTTKNFEDTKAHWSYRLKANRALGNLFGVGSGGCTDFHSGIGNVSYIKDILTETVVTAKFNCSKFGSNTDPNLGWGRMNYCFRNKCPKGYAFFKGVPFRLDNHGSFSYSASSEFSGITHDATAFVGCVAGKCCACFGTKGGRGHYCSRKCKAVNGGTIITGKVYVWFWIRTRMPKRLWKRCMEFKMKTEAGKSETYYIDRMTGTAHKGTCSEQFQAFLNEGTLVVKNKESLNNIPSVPGLLSYREDNEKLYVKKGNKWDAIGSENETKNLVMTEVTHLEKNLADQKKIQGARTQNLESSINKRLTQLEQHLKARLKKIEGKVPYTGRWPSGSYCILANGKCPSGFSRSHGYMKAIKMYTTNSAYMKQVYFGDSKIMCHDSCRGWGDLVITACCK
ncbi:Hypothetical predicted protein [Paramuricea clavata]|nr:Hypothetical predicted protein [Paramuricea clavata]